MQTAFRKAAGSELVAEYTAGIDIDCMMDDAGVQNWCMTIDDPVFPVVMLGPIQSDWTAQLVHLSSRIPVKNKAFHFFPFLADKGFFDSGMRGNSSKLGDPLVKRSLFIELHKHIGQLPSLVRRTVLQFSYRSFQAMLDLNIVAK